MGGPGWRCAPSRRHSWARGAAPLVEGAGWLAQAALLLAAQSGVGALARRVPLARSLTIACQMLVTLVLLTLVFARDHALFGLLPGAQAVMRLGELLAAGGEDIGTYAIPAPMTDGIRLVVVGGVVLVGLAVDALAVTLRSAARPACRCSRCTRSPRGSVTAGRAGSGSCWPPRAICCSCWPRAATGSPSGGGSSAVSAGPRAGCRTGSPAGAGARPPRYATGGASVCWRWASPWWSRSPCPPWTAVCWAPRAAGAAGAAGAGRSPR